MLLAKRLRSWLSACLGRWCFGWLLDDIPPHHCLRPSSTTSLDDLLLMIFLHTTVSDHQALLLAVYLWSLYRWYRGHKAVTMFVNDLSLNEQTAWFSVKFVKITDFAWLLLISKPHCWFATLTIYNGWCSCCAISVIQTHSYAYQIIYHVKADCFYW